MHRLDIHTARRVAVKAQMLDSHRPVDLLSTVERLTSLQIDPTAAVAPSADLVAWSRLGDGHHPDDLKRAGEVDRTIYEQNAPLRPMDDLRLHLADMRAWPHHAQVRDWLAVNDSFRRDILDLLGFGALALERHPGHQCSAVAIVGLDKCPQRHPDARVPGQTWRGGDSRAPRAAASLGRRREGVPAGYHCSPSEEAQQIRNERRLRALGIARPNLPQQPIEPYHVGEAGEPATVEGVEGEWRVDPGLLVGA